MSNKFITKLILIISALIFTFTLSSCGKYSDFRDEVNALNIDVAFPEATSEATTMAEAEAAIRQQQISLAKAYDESYQITETDVYKEKYANINEERIFSELSSTRNRINSESATLFSNNLSIILENVADCPNKDSYIDKCIADVKGFYTEYIKYSHYTEDDYDEVTSFLLNYYDRDNEFIKWLLLEKEDFIAECATLSIEANGAVTYDQAVSYYKNFNIITALNELYNGVSPETDREARINKVQTELKAYVKNLQFEHDAQLANIETQQNTEETIEIIEETQETQN